MKTAKLLWSSLIVFALFLPLAFAQTSVAISWVYFIVNTIIIWIMLFIVVAIIGSGLGETEKKVVYAGAFFIALLLSWNFVGGGGFIWKVGLFSQLFRLKFIVNTIALSIIFTILLRLLKIESPSTEGKVGMWVLILIMAGFLAFGMDYYFWQAGTGKQIIGFLFGKEGILTFHENRLFIFLATLIVWSWFFNVLGIGGEDMKFFNYLMAFIISSNFAGGPNPMSPENATHMVEALIAVIFAMGLYKRFRG